MAAHPRCVQLAGDFGLVHKRKSASIIGIVPKGIAARALRLLAVGGLIGLVTGFHHSIGLTNATTVALSLLLIVLAVATLWGLVESLVASVVATLFFNYFFLPPIGTWTIADPENWVAMFAFLVVSVVASQLSERARRKAREALEHQQERVRLAEVASHADMVRQREEFKSTLLDALAHELKTPLTSLKASVSALRANPTTESHNQTELLAIIEEETDRLIRLVSEILHMARLEAGQLRLNREQCVVGGLIAGACEYSRRILNGRSVQVSVPPDLPLVVADAALVQTVLGHLFENAAKYSTPGSPIDVRALEEGSRVQIRITSHGPGLSEEELPRIFDRYYRGPRTEDTVPGMGIGLSIAREIVAAHGGRIWADSRPGNGTSFTLTLPIADKS